MKVKVVEGIVDVSSMEGRSCCELRWDFQDWSPILQVTDIGLNPENVMMHGYHLLFKVTCCLFSWIPIPLSKQPLATARIKRETET